MARYRPHLDALCVTAISSNRELALVDLTGAGTYELGIDTDANRARDHGRGVLESRMVLISRHGEHALAEIELWLHKIEADIIPIDCDLVDLPLRLG